MSQQTVQLTLNSGNPPASRSYSYQDATRLVQEHQQYARYREAAAVAEQLAEQLPGDPAVQLMASESLLFSGEAARAMEYADRTAALLPDTSPALLMKSRAALDLHDSDQALAYMEAALAQQPDNSIYHCEMGDLCRKTGDFDRAKQNYTKSLELNARNTTSLFNLTMLPDYQCPEDLVKRIEFIVQSRQLPPLDQAHAHFALANIYEQQRKVADHFRHLNAGNATFDRAYQFNPEVLAQDTANIVDFFSAGFFKTRPGLLENHQEIVFIIGMPRSGSTLVEQILSSHSRVSDVGENSYLSNALQRCGEAHALQSSYPNFLAETSPEFLQSLADDYLEAVSPAWTGELLTDKTLGNYHYVGLLHLLFPQARFVNVQRHPVANCYGCYKRLFAMGALPWSYNLEHIAAYYRNYRRIMAHWDSVLPGKIHHLEYESLVANQRQVTQDLLDYCGLSWEDNCLDFHKSARTVATSSNIQVRQKLYTGAVDQWRQYTDYLGPLISLAAEE